MTGEANYVGTIMADKVTGLTALYATMMALFHRERTGEGQEVEVGMFETMASFMLVEHANGAMFDPPLGPAVYPRTVAPNRKPYRTSDGYIAALIYNDKQWNAFVDAVRPAWATDLYATLERRALHIDTVYGLLAETIKERTTAEWLALFRELRIPAAPLSTPDALFDNPHLNAVGFFETVDTPHGPVRFPGVPTCRRHEVGDNRYRHGRSGDRREHNDDDCGRTAAEPGLSDDETGRKSKQQVLRNHRGQQQAEHERLARRHRVNSRHPLRQLSTAATRRPPPPLSQRQHHKKHTDHYLDHSGH